MANTPAKAYTLPTEESLRAAMGKRPGPRRQHSLDLISAAKGLADGVETLRFALPVTHVYNPLQYAWEAHERYLRQFADGPKRIVFLGMNPGPFGMVQTGVPFGEISAVRDWLGITGEVVRPKVEHPQRPIIGFNCVRSEVSGQRLWGLFAARFGTAEKFFEEHFVLNYCPLAFLEETGRNRTPDKLSLKERTGLFALCDQHLRHAIAALGPEWVIGIGDFATKRAKEVFSDGSLNIGQILHPSPASPAANREWASTATRQLATLGIWR
jgi:single-strand selective monofunctional uracil DNA glycosylase